jgi:hypothetical protein
VAIPCCVIFWRSSPPITAALPTPFWPCRIQLEARLDAPIKSPSPGWSGMTPDSCARPVMTCNNTPLRQSRTKLAMAAAVPIWPVANACRMPSCHRVPHRDTLPRACIQSFCAHHRVSLDAQGTKRVRYSWHKSTIIIYSIAKLIFSIARSIKCSSSLFR